MGILLGLLSEALDDVARKEMQRTQRSQPQTSGASKKGRYQITYMKVQKAFGKKVTYPVQREYVEATSLMDARGVFKSRHTPIHKANGDFTEYKINSVHKVG